MDDLIIFFNGYGDHRDLHSFPTRRSSDLAEGEREGEAAESRAPGDHRDRRGPRRRGSGRASIAMITRRSTFGGDRKSTRLNSRHTVISYPGCCLTKTNTS